MSATQSDSLMQMSLGGSDPRGSIFSDEPLKLASGERRILIALAQYPEGRSQWRAVTKVRPEARQRWFLKLRAVARDARTPDWLVEGVEFELSVDFLNFTAIFLWSILRPPNRGKNREINGSRGFKSAPLVQRS
jgi:hypothetical protein